MCYTAFREEPLANGPLKRPQMPPFYMKGGKRRNCERAIETPFETVPRGTLGVGKEEIAKEQLKLLSVASILSNLLVGKEEIAKEQLKRTDGARDKCILRGKRRNCERAIETGEH